MERIKTFPGITINTGTVVHENGRKTFHVKLQTTIRKLADDGKYYEWPVLVRRSVGYLRDPITPAVEQECVELAFEEIIKTSYAILVTGIVNTDIKTLPTDEPFFVEWGAHPHTISEKERIDYLMDNHKY